MKYSLLFCGLLFISGSQLAFADDAISSSSQQTILTLSAQAENYVENDTLTVIFYKEETAPSHKQLNHVLDKANQLFNTIIKNHDSSIMVNMQNLSGYPIFDKNGKLKHWQGRVIFTLQGNNFDILAPYLKNLSEHFAIENLTYSVSNNRRNQSTDELLPKALERLKQKATIIAENLGKKVINISKIDINDNNSFMPERYLLAESATNKSDDLFSSRKTINNQKGKSFIRVSLNGQVILE